MCRKADYLNGFLSDSHASGCLVSEGGVFEASVLGRCKVTCTGYLNYRDAMDKVRKHQPEHTTDAVKKLMKTFRTLLGADELRFFTAVGSALDRYHGVDAFFELRGIIVTVDVTTNPDKTIAKADLVLHEDDWGNPTDLAARIAFEILRKGTPKNEHLRGV